LFPIFLKILNLNFKLASTISSNLHRSADCLINKIKPIMAEAADSGASHASNFVFALSNYSECIKPFLRTA